MTSASTHLLLICEHCHNSRPEYNTINANIRAITSAPLKSKLNTMAPAIIISAVKIIPRNIAIFLESFSPFLCTPDFLVIPETVPCANAISRLPVLFSDPHIYSLPLFRLIFEHIFRTYFLFIESISHIQSNKTAHILLFRTFVYFVNILQFYVRIFVRFYVSRYQGRIVVVHSTKQSIGIIALGFYPQHHINCNACHKKDTKKLPEP